MRTLLLFALLPCLATGQEVIRVPRKVPGADKPVCSRGAICFSGKVTAAEEFRKPLNADLVFVLQRGWTIAIVPTRSEGDCKEFASVVNPPYRAHRPLYIDRSYGFSAENEVLPGAREFVFVTNCADYRTESDRLTAVMWPADVSNEKYEQALAHLGSLATGKGRLWITGSKISHAADTADDKRGTIEWLTFTVEIILPAAK